MFQSLLNGILEHCIVGFKLFGVGYELKGEFNNDIFILGVNFGFGVILAFSLCFFIKLVKWGVRKCLRR